MTSGHRRSGARGSQVDRPSLGEEREGPAWRFAWRAVSWGQRADPHPVQAGLRGEALGHPGIRPDAVWPQPTHGAEPF